MMAPEEREQERQQQYAWLKAQPELVQLRALSYLIGYCPEGLQAFRELYEGESR